MKIKLLTTLLFLALVNLCQTLEAEFTLRSLLFETNESTIKEIFKSLFMDYANHTNLLLQLGLCEYFNFTRLMPKDPLLLKPFIESLKQKGLSQKLHERFYNFDQLQYSKRGRKFLIETNVNFARKEWNPYIFAIEEVKEILVRINDSLPSQVEHLDASSLAYVLDQDDDGKSGFFSLNGRWNLFSIPGFFDCMPFSHILILWLKQVKSQVANDDLLFYRLTCLCWYSEVIDTEPSFVAAAKELLEKTPLTEFRESVLKYFSQKRKTVCPESFLKIPDSILKDNPVSQATLHFEHLFAAFEMGYDVPLDEVIEAFRKFDPSLVSPFVCKSLLKRINYSEFALILKEYSPGWERLYLNTHRALVYFPRKFLPANVQLRLWRYQRLCVKDSPRLSSWPKLFLNNPLPWKQYTGNDEYDILLWENMVEERDGFTFIDCQANEQLISIFMERRIIQFLLSDEVGPLPTFIPLVQEYDLVDEEKYDFVMARDIADLCIVNDITGEPTYSDGYNSLKVIKNAYKYWGAPKCFFALP